MLQCNNNMHIYLNAPISLTPEICFEERFLYTHICISNNISLLNILRFFNVIKCYKIL